MPLGADAWWFTVLPVIAAMPWRCSLAPPAPRADQGPSVIQPKQEAAPARVASARPPAAPSSGIALPDEVVLRAAGAGQPAFLACWARAQRLDPLVSPGKVRLRLAIDAGGRVTAVDCDAESAALARCLAVVARSLPFPAPGQPAVVELPVIFR